MARFKLVKIGRRKVEVQKVRFKLNLVALLISFACAVLVWLYMTGRNPRPESDPSMSGRPEESAAVESTRGETTVLTELVSAYSVLEVSACVNGGLVCEA